MHACVCVCCKIIKSVSISEPITIYYTLYIPVLLSLHSVDQYWYHANNFGIAYVANYHLAVFFLYHKFVYWYVKTSTLVCKHPMRGNLNNPEFFFSPTCISVHLGQKQVTFLIRVWDILSLSVITNVRIATHFMLNWWV